MERFDVVVVGAGSSGGVLAARLSEDRGCRVLLLEAGPDFPDEAQLLPSFVVGGDHGWEPRGVPEHDWDSWASAGDGLAPVRVPRGKLVGGSSMVNGTIAVRGAAAAFDRWAAAGNVGWSWRDVLKYYIRVENDWEFGHEPYHGDKGPIAIRRYPQDAWTSIAGAFAEACSDLGFAEAPDLNHPDADAGVVGPWPNNRVNLVRLGTLVTYIRAARQNPNLVIRGDALVDRVVIRGATATGVSYIDADGTRWEVAGERIVLCAGAYGTPPILLRSGIGPASELRALAVDVVEDLAVGRNLRDHAGCTFKIKSPGLAKLNGPPRAVNCRGPRTASGEPEWQSFAAPIDEAEGLAIINVALTRQDSVGRVCVTSLDPGATPTIEHRYNTEESDLARFEHAWEFCREVVSHSAFRKHDARELTEGRSAREIVRETVDPGLHGFGTCKMGAGTDPTAVVSPALEVHGVSNLMVADASVFPEDIMFNLNLTCYVVGEVAADLVRGAAATAREMTAQDAVGARPRLAVESGTAPERQVEAVEPC